MQSGASNPQQVVDRYFDAEAAHWRDVYEDQGLQGVVYRQRMEIALEWSGELGLSPHAAALDVGCGAGLLSVGMARRGLHVTATDSSKRMVALTRELARGQRLDEQVRALPADVHSLPFGAGQFEFVVALGLLPWLHTPRAAVVELARVVSPGGWLIVTADNRLRLNALTEPRENPLLAALKPAVRAARALRGTRPRGGAPSHLHLPRSIDRMLQGAGMTPLRRTSIGYGPFTFLGRPLLEERVALRLNVVLTRLASGPLPLLRRCGWHYMVAARKLTS